MFKPSVMGIQAHSSCNSTSDVTNEEHVKHIAMSVSPQGQQGRSHHPTPSCVLCSHKMGAHE